MPQTPDPLEMYLRTSPTAPAMKADLWDAFHAATDADDLAVRLRAIKVPDQVKASLWDLKSNDAPHSQPMPTQAQAPDQPGAVSRFVGGAAEMLNPVSMVEGLYNTVRHPLDTGAAIYAQQGQQFDKAVERARQGHYSEAFGHGAAAFLPVVGPLAADIGEQAATGDIAGAAGKTAGLLGGGEVLKLATKAPMAARSVVRRVANMADDLATKKMTDVMVQKVGPNKIKMGVTADKVAPQVVRQTSAITKGGLQDQITAKLDAAGTALEAAYDQVPKTRMYATQPIKDALQVAIKNLSVKGPLAAGAVEPATRLERIAALKQAIKEVDALGGITNLDNLRTLKQAWGEGAKAVFTPSIAQDAMKLKNAGAGWADAYSEIGDYMASKHPELKPLNADVSLWKKASDVMQAAEEIERVRPTVGREIMSRGLGAAVGAAGGGAFGAAMGAMVAPTVERLLAEGAPTVKITAARLLAKTSDALKAGQTTQAAAYLKSLQALGAKAAPVARAGTLIEQATRPAASPSTVPPRSTAR